ncbi:substrate-binding domain-containing protein [Mycobacterium sp.]|uniref:substrate-binding domain-containing protein n=1 Tax=Mycobacterium sp. TaxID=1785 RepID=UPI002BBBDA42|nr:substrate-binding domain-containing protein [Mycobacterium sp.]HKP40868.1 substrate-binding domain-containing protein [Mycobacterium sp.]
MGRHSIPDPEDSADEGQPEEPQTERFGSVGEEPDYGPGFDDTDYGQPDYGRPGYREPEYGPPAYDQPEYRQPGYGESRFHEPGFDESRYDDTDYDEPAYAEPEPRRRASTPPSAPPRSGSQHSGEWEGGEWTGSHRAVTTGRRGVSFGVIAALVTVVVVVGGIILWRFFGDALSHRTDAAAARCVDGDLAVAVVVDASIADRIQTLANTYNQSAAPVGDKCVKVGVKPADSDQVVNGFIGKWPAELGERPALWIPASSVSEARLEAAAGVQTVSDSRSLVTSPVLLAIRPQLTAALSQQNWGTLPSLQTNPAALDGLNLPGWGSLRLALPISGDADASYLAAEAVAAASAPAGSPPSAGTGAVNTLVGGQPKLADNKASTAMDALLNATDPATSQVHAVVTTEQQLFQRGTSLPDAKNVVASWLPPGPTAMADYPTVLLSGNWLSQEQVSAASEFARFMRKPEQLAELAKAGFRTEGGTPPKSDVTSFAPVSAPLSVGDNAMRATLANALTAPAESPAVTIMLDQSMPTNEGGKSRLANVVAALNARLQALPATSTVGLWTFDGTEGRSEVSTGPLSDPVSGQARSAALTSALNSQTASAGGAVSFTTLRMIFTDMMANYRQGQNNSILVITAGPHTDQSLDGPGLQQYIRGAFDPARPLAVNVIDFGNDSDRATWEAVAQASGGNYQNLTSSAGPELTSAIATMLG